VSERERGKLRERSRCAGKLELTKTQPLLLKVCLSECVRCSARQEENAREMRGKCRTAGATVIYASQWLSSWLRVVGK